MSFIDLGLANPVVCARETAAGQLGPLGARYVMDGRASEGRFALIEHPIAPRGLAAPLHRRTREDELSFILEGRWGFQLGEKVVYGEPGDLIFKPRNVWHTFWNATDGPARLLEIISPAGFEHYLSEVSALVAEHRFGRPDLLRELAARYGLEIDLGSIDRLVSAHGLVM